MIDKNINWKLYKNEVPKKIGYYWFRAKSHTIKDLTVSYVGQMRERGAGYDTVISPCCDYWTGYRIIVPEELEWAEYDGEIKDKYTFNHDFGFEEDMLPCPFCGRVPVFQLDGAWIGASPLDSKNWYIRCCNGIWITKSNPRDVINEWNKRYEFQAI
jgi:hypothetical protein